MLPLLLLIFPVKPHRKDVCRFCPGALFLCLCHRSRHRLLLSLSTPYNRGSEKHSKVFSPHLLFCCALIADDSTLADFAAGLPDSEALVCRKIKFIALLYYFISELYKFVGLFSFALPFGIWTQRPLSGPKPHQSANDARPIQTNFGNGLIQLPVL